MTRREIFLEAVSKATAAERSAYLSSACGEDAALREELERLCRAHDEAGSFLLDPLFAPPVAPPVGASVAPPAAEAPGTRVGPYLLIEPIGEGGMGTVWRAEQLEPVRREVAVKVVKASMASAQLLHRFEAERQALALMDHPNIAKVLDAGTIERPGEPPRPYFAMEMVRGVPFTRYCDERRLTLRQRLELFVPICQAVQHAHQNGVIHRDLKPSNVLVCDAEGGPVPKVIDFGIAKAAGTRLTDRTLFTEVGQVLGTLEYMSPEQAQDPMGVDTRSDVYSLGVMLFETLTGTRPFDREHFQRARAAEGLGWNREEEAPRASVRLAAAQAEEVAALRGLTPPRLLRLVRGDLDWITMRCLERDRERRYESAAALASDLRRHLRHEPVQARPPSLGYRLRKWVRRRPAQATTLAAVTLIAAGGVGLLLWLDRQATARAGGEALRLARLVTEVDVAEREARSLGERAEGRVDDLAQWQAGSAAALSAIRRARTLAHEAGAGLEPALLARLTDTSERLEADARDLRLLSRMEDFLQEVSEVDPKKGMFRSVVPLAKVEDAFRDWGIEYGRTPHASVRERIESRPARVRASILAMIFHCYTLTPAPNPEWVRPWLNRCIDLVETDPWRQAALRALGTRAWTTLDALVEDLDASSQPPDFLNMLAGIPHPTQSEPFRRAVLRKAQAAYPSDFWLTEKLAFSCANSDPPQIEDAIRYHTAALALRPRNPGVWVNLGGALRRRQPPDLRDAARAFERAIGLDPAYVTAWGLLVSALRAIGEDWPRAIQAARAWVERAPDDPEALATLRDILRDHGDLREAVAAYRRAIERAPEDPRLRVGLASALLDMGDAAGAEAECRVALALDPRSTTAYQNLGFALEELGQLAAAEDALRAAVEWAQDHGRRAISLSNLGLVQKRRGDYAGAIASYRAAIDLDSKRPEPHYNLGLALHCTFERDGAIEAFRRALALRPAYTSASVELSRELFRAGDLGGSLAVLEAALRSLPDGHALRAQVLESIEERRRYLALDRRLPEVLAGRDQPADPTEEWDFAQLAARRGLWRSAARWSLHALALQPDIVSEANGALFDAAAFTAMGAAAQGDGEPEATEQERATWRAKSLEFLRARLTSLAQALATATPLDRLDLRWRIENLQRIPELSPLRDPSAIARLPPSEQARFRALWEEAAALRELAASPAPPR